MDARFLFKLETEISDIRMDKHEYSYIMFTYLILFKGHYENSNLLFQIGVVYSYQLVDRLEGGVYIIVF